MEDFNQLCPMVALFAEYAPFTSSEAIVDVGGGLGAFSAACLEAAPHTQATLFDLPDVVKQAQRVSVAACIRACGALPPHPVAFAAVVICEGMQRSGCCSAPCCGAVCTQAWQQRHAEMMPRITFVGGSFFETGALPAAPRVGRRGGLYVMRQILHDWGDADALRILKAVRALAGCA